MTTVISVYVSVGTMRRYHYVAWYGAQIVGTYSSGHPALPSTEVRCELLMAHHRFPIVDRPMEAPFERRCKISYARVKRYDCHEPGQPGIWLQ